MNSAGAFEHEHGFVGSKVACFTRFNSTSPYTASVETWIIA